MLGQYRLISNACFHSNDVVGTVAEGTAWCEAHHLSMGVNIPTDFTASIANYNLPINSPWIDFSTEVDGDVVRHSDIVGILRRMGRDNCWGSSWKIV